MSRRSLIVALIVVAAADRAALAQSAVAPWAGLDPCHPSSPLILHPSADGSCSMQVTSRNGTVLPSMTVFNLYWGTYYQPNHDGYAIRYWVDDRAPFVFDSPKFWAPLKEYSTSKTQITGSGAWGGGFGANQGLGSSSLVLSRADFEAELGREIDNFAAATDPTFAGYHLQPSGNAYFVVWLPPGVITQQIIDDQYPNAYHSYMVHNGANVYYAVIRAADRWTCGDGLGTPIEVYDDSMFISETHEIYESMTNPLGDNSGYRASAFNFEIGDLCGRGVTGSYAVTSWDCGPAGSINVQREWSLNQCTCVDIYTYGSQLTAPPSPPRSHGGGGIIRGCNGHVCM